MDEDLIIDMLEVLVKHGCVDDIRVRNMKIKRDYKRLCAAGVTGGEAKSMLSDRYFIGDKAIDKVIYDLGRTRKDEIDPKREKIL